MSRVAFVTGVASGIGFAVAERMRDDGATVVGFDLRPDGPDGVEVVAGDVTDRASVETTIGQATSTHGRIDVVANVAGVPQFGRVDELGSGRSA